MAKRKVSWTKQHDGLLGMGGKGDDTFKFDIPSGYQFAGLDASVVKGRSKPGVRVISKPGHGETGKNKKAKVHWWFDSANRSFIKYKCTATLIDGAITKSQRAMLVVCDLSYDGDKKFRELYQWIESSGLSVVKNTLGDDYKHFKTLSGSSATARNFITSLSDLSRKSGIQAIDVVLMLHGRKNKICFRGGALTGGSDGTIRKEIGSLNLGRKLRACFSTCCWGETVADDLVAAGFRVACGSRDVYANGAYGIPTALHSWECGDKFATAVAKANNQAILAVTDAIASAIDPLFATANSYWTISGSGSTKITS
ncbi:hypothetical protein JW926_10780 [Candidatus Sumerlaeota bacterium]|nr:hypothetical protein [Candidatus Sumerlaeota bacterium]